MTIDRSIALYRTRVRDNAPPKKPDLLWSMLDTYQDLVENGPRLGGIERGRLSLLRASFIDRLTTLVDRTFYAYYDAYAEQTQKRFGLNQFSEIDEMRELSHVLAFHYNDLLKKQADRGLNKVEKSELDTLMNAYTKRYRILSNRYLLEDDVVEFRFLARTLGRPTPELVRYSFDAPVVPTAPVAVIELKEPVVVRGKKNATQVELLAKKKQAMRPVKAHVSRKIKSSANPDQGTLLSSL